MKKIVLLVLIMFGVQLQAQDKNARAVIEVDGVCGMCKERIEKAAIKTKGVKTATWNIGTHQLSLIFDENKTTLQTIEENVAAAGHDTDNVKAPKEAYEDLHHCCKYRDEEVVGQHPE
ncbi:MAG TPA: heavy-metal-associated domain-containing protein [Flavobacteriaceae bacterium]|nr:heavy-metal-associated domain-containing protein [Flavobacteriaceae bacterium]